MATVTAYMTPSAGQAVAEVPLGHSAAVTPSDTDDLPVQATRLYIGVAGDVKLILAGNTSEVLYKAMPVGWTRPLAVRRVMSTGTTATNIVAEW